MIWYRDRGWLPAAQTVYSTSFFFYSFYVRVRTMTAIWTVGHRLRSTPTTGHWFTALIGLQSTAVPQIGLQFSGGSATAACTVANPDVHRDTALIDVLSRRVPTKDIGMACRNAPVQISKIYMVNGDAATIRRARLG